MKWVISLIIGEYEKLEDRIEKVLLYAFSSESSDTCYVLDIDATGYNGNLLTQKINLDSGITCSKEELLKIIREDGQVLELDLIIGDPQKYRVTVRDGNIIDFLGEAELPFSSTVGEYNILDINRFN